MQAAACRYSNPDMIQIRVQTVVKSTKYKKYQIRPFRYLFVNRDYRFYRLSRFGSRLHSLEPSSFQSSVRVYQILNQWMIQFKYTHQYTRHYTLLCRQQNCNQYSRDIHVTPSRDLELEKTRFLTNFEENLKKLSKTKSELISS